MPNIVQYTSPVDRVNPSNVGTEAYQRAGYMLGREGNEQAQMIDQAGRSQEVGLDQIGAGLQGAGREFNALHKVAQRHQTQQEILNGSAQLAGMADNLNTQYNTMATNAAPNDTSVSSDFRTNILQPALDKFVGGFQTEKGKEWATERATRLAMHFYHTTAADDMRRAGDAAITNLSETQDQLAATAYKNPDFGDHALAEAPAIVQGMVEHSGMDPADAAKFTTERLAHMQGEIALNTIRGAIDQNPEAGLALLNSGKYDKFLPPNALPTMTKYAEHAAHMGAMASHAETVFQTKQQDDNVKAAALSLQQSTETPNGEMLPPDYMTNLHKIGKMPGAERSFSLLRSMAQFGQKLLLAQERAQKLEAGGATPAELRQARMQHTDPTTMDQVLWDVETGTMSHGAILGMAGKGLSASDAQWLSTLVPNAKATGARGELVSLAGVLASAKTALTGPDPASRTPGSMAAYGRAQAFIVAAFRRGLAAGIPAVKLTDPKSQDYILKGNLLATLSTLEHNSTPFAVLPGARSRAFPATPGAAASPTAASSKFLYHFKMPEGAATGGPSGNATLPLIHQLEGSGPDAVSPAGAIGRGQVMPSTAREFGFDPAKLTDPAYNDEAASAVLGSLQQQFPGDREAQLVGYNAGPGVAEKFVKSGHDVSILPHETQLYLQHAARITRPSLADIFGMRTGGGA